MRKNPYGRPDDSDERRAQRIKWYEAHRKEVKEQFRLLAQEGEVATEGKRRVKKIIFEYDDSPESLLEAAQGMTLLCAALFPETRAIAKQFVNAFAKYRRGDVKTLDDAFGISRPKHWRQNSESFYSKYRHKIAHDIGNLLDNGGVTPDVFDAVGNNYCKSGKTIEKIYYRVINEDYEKFLAIERAFEEFQSEHPELPETQASKSFSRGFIERFRNK